MYKNIHFLSVKFIIIYSQIYSLSECFAAKEAGKRQSYYQHRRFPVNLCAAGMFREIFTEISQPRKWGKWWGTRKLPGLHTHPAHRATPVAHECVCTGCGERRNTCRMYIAVSHQWYFLTRLLQSTKILLHYTARYQSRVGSEFLRWFMLLCSMFLHPAGVMPFYNCKTNIRAGGFS